MAFRLAVFASGSGTTLQNLLDRVVQGTLAGQVELVISDQKDAYALERARQAGVADHFLAYKRESFADFSRAAFALCREAKVELVVLGGFLRLLTIPEDFEQRVINVHPALIPAFSGKGYYGRRVHEAVLEYGVKVTGCTVHFCDNEYDHGPIVSQRVVEVLADDTAEILAGRVQAAEREALPEAIQWFAEGRVEVVGRRVRIRD